MNFKRQGRAFVHSACNPGPSRPRKVRSAPFPPGVAKPPPAPLLVLSPCNPLRWALAGAPITGGQDKVVQRSPSGVQRGMPPASRFADAPLCCVQLRTV